MNRLVISPAAKSDLDRIRDYIAIDLGNPDAGEKAIKKLHDAFRLLLHHTKLGKRCERYIHLVPGVRELIVDTYIV